MPKDKYSEYSDEASLRTLMNVFVRKRRFQKCDFPIHYPTAEIKILGNLVRYEFLSKMQKKHHFLNKIEKGSQMYIWEPFLW
ncbi:hypothetical protein [Kurthia senegalensis]|uniref:hypothetical protein n=1 Tax=Kurthia senegalensis TaxID=1033740 RepID=UPI000288B9AC|nr:hypothetical protein [Kurthia senegalensis]